MSKKHFLLWGVLLGLSSCYYDVEDELYIVRNCDLPAVVTFADDVNPIIQQSCAIVGCHISSNPDRVSLETYDNIKATIDNNGFQTRTFDNLSMPPAGPLSACHIDILKKWIEDGAPNN